MHLRTVRTRAAAGHGAAPVLGQQHQPLGQGGGAAGPAQMQRQAVAVEQRQPRAAVGGELQDVGDRQQRAAGGQPVAGALLQISQTHRDHDIRGQAVDGPRRLRGEHAFAQGEQRVVIPLTRGAGVVAYLLFGGFAVEAGVLVSGVAHPRGGVALQQRLQGGPRLRRQQPVEGPHPVGALLADPDVGQGLAVLIGELPVLVEQVEHVRGGCPERFGAEFAGMLGQLFFGVGPGLEVHEAGQLTEEPPHMLDVLGADQPLRLTARERGHGGCHWLAGQRGPRPQQRRLIQPAARLRGRNPQPLRQHCRVTLGT
ncbi:Uncharacterised protein [Mycobacteroides abscessus subsp. abscessus]|nr:Uncharacterised protein [Mycobacteroides abscessus subsp. abscessus]